MPKLKTKSPDLVLLLLSLILITCSPKRPPISDQPIVVLTFDDAVKSHITNVAPLLKAYGFNATFFVTYAWMKDTINFMSWKDIKALHKMGFEIGNHSWTHNDFSQPKNGYELEGELGMVEYMLKRNGVPKPISYAHTGNKFGPEAIDALNKRGYLFARRGKQPEVPYGELAGGPGYDIEFHHPLLVPTTLDFYPEMNMEIFKRVMKSIPDYEIPVLQFHGVPDVSHPWVNTPLEQFKLYMDYLKEAGYRVIAMRELESFIPELLPDDPHLVTRYTGNSKEVSWPSEVIEARNNRDYWINVMRRHHYTRDEMGMVLGLPMDSVISIKKQIPHAIVTDTNRIEVLPYPGGRHPRIDFTDGMLSPMRGTKMSIFLPGEKFDYVVLDIPEAIYTQYGLTFLGHKHIPTVFDKEQITISNTEWRQDTKGNYLNVWQLPNNIEIGAKVSPKTDRVLLKLWLTNNTSDTLLSQLQTQVCLMLGQTMAFARQNNDNKILNCPISAVRSKSGDQWILTGWEGCSYPWGNEDSPCLHADPILPNCKPGETVLINGIVWFYNGTEIENEMNRIRQEYSWL